ncbi:isocitrate lyase/phosphoenolpyruvate mutase family protein [Nocardioides sp.]|uniref:isocitrate lyase/PEP mutase family protein n=1 Tax=Nocardioides sp. TaxID=35761 RepID=UPI002607F005|nr:isocitrate lyase/phosphoenolpyruvate mutase family protein [Nocardioides sp.]MDI6912215.1 isocitrate lyase/phosphoenolpyruvate mutase family protein [Nocardioides sp.]
MSFRALHHADLPLLLPNAWDVPSAIAFVEAGFPAVGTTSFGVATSAGHPDGDGATREANLVLAQRLARLPVHVSIDIEDGYSEDPDEVADYVAGLGAVGVAGVNLEDSAAARLVEPARFAAKVAAVKERSPDVFVNARVDTYWFDQDATVPATVARALAYVEAGADGVFVPGLADPAAIREIAAAVPAPLNLLVTPGRTLRELADLGVRRVSTGSLPYRAAVDAAVRVATAVRDDEQLPTATSYAEAQERVHRYP